MLPLHQQSQVGVLQTSLSLVSSDARFSPDETRATSDNLRESPAENATPQETCPTAAATAAKKMESGKAEVNRLEQPVIHRVSSADKVYLQDIARESVDIICEKMNRLPKKFLNELKNGLRGILEGGYGSRYKEELFIMQKFVQSRTDLTTETLIRAHRVQLEILVALKTGIPEFLHPIIISFKRTSLVEIFGYKRCRNIACQNRLPANDCTCEICTSSNGFCNLCMCVICNKFDSEENTCRWVGCNFCSHWTHTDCAIHKQLISTGPSVNSGAGLSEMVFRCQACNRTSELLGWVKDVFQCCAPSWNGEAFSRELDCVSKIFHVSNDPRGRKLLSKCNDLKEKLRSLKMESIGACKAMLTFFQDTMAEPASFEELLALAGDPGVQTVGSTHLSPTSTPAARVVRQLPTPQNGIEASSGAGSHRRDQFRVPSNRGDKEPRVSLEVTPEQQAKKSKRQKVRLDGFTRVEYDAYVENPFAVCMQVGKYGCELLEKWKADAEEREAETREERDQLRLEKGELQTELTNAGTTLECLRKDLADTIASKKVAESKFQDAEKKVKGLEGANSILHRQLAKLQVDLDVMRKERDDAKLQVNGVARKAVDFAQDAFQKALDQVHCLYPEAALDPEIFKMDHEVRGGKIVKPHANKIDFDVIAPTSP